MPYFQLAKRRGYGSLTQSANTVIDRLVEPELNCFTTLQEVLYTVGTTAHTLTIMRPLGKVFTTAAAAASQAVINITQDPGVYSTNYGVINTADNAIAANDYVVYQCADGTYILDTVSSVSTLAITMTNNVPTSTVLKGAPFWWFGITTDTNPVDNHAHEKFTMFAAGSGTQQVRLGNDAGETNSGFFGSAAPPGAMSALSTSAGGKWPLTGKNEPLILHSNNATTAGTIEKVVVAYTILA